MGQSEIFGRTVLHIRTLINRMLQPPIRLRSSASPSQRGPRRRSGAGCGGSTLDPVDRDRLDHFGPARVPAVHRLPPQLRLAFVGARFQRVIDVAPRRAARAALADDDRLGRRHRSSASRRALMTGSTSCNVAQSASSFATRRSASDRVTVGSPRSTDTRACASGARGRPTASPGRTPGTGRRGRCRRGSSRRRRVRELYHFYRGRSYLGATGRCRTSSGQTQPGSARGTARGDSAGKRPRSAGCVYSTCVAPAT